MARLPQGIVKRADGLLQKRFTVNGKRYSIYGHTLDEIADKEQAKRLQIAAGEQSLNKSITLDKYFERFLIERGKSVKGGTLVNYKCVYYKHISKVYGHRKIRSLEKGELQDYQTSLLENPKISKTSVNNIIKVFSIVLNAAYQDEIIIRNPLAGVKSVKNDNTKAVKTIHRALTEQEQESLFSELKRIKAFYYELLTLLLLTGMRVGEVVALQWQDIDYKANVIHITKTLGKNSDGAKIFNSPKTKTSVRDIPLTEPIKQILAEQKRKYLTLVAANGSKIINTRIFATPYGYIPTSSQINRNINRAIKSLKKQGIEIERITCHGLRDTFATRYIEQGGNPQTLKVILGHSSLSMTMDLYSHVLPNTKQEEMDRLIFKGL